MENNAINLENDGFDREEKEINSITPVIIGGFGVAVGYYLGHSAGLKKANAIAEAQISDLVISPIDSDLAYTESAFDPLVAAGAGPLARVSPHFLMYSILVCQGLRHIDYIKRDYERLASRDTAIGDAHFRSGGFKRFFNYLKHSNHLISKFGAESAIKFETTNGILFTENFAAVSEANDPEHGYAFTRYRARNTMSSRIKDTLMFYSMSRGLFANSLLLDYFKSKYNGTGVSFNNLKNYPQDFRVLIAMSKAERTIIDGIISKGVIITHNPVAGEFRLVCYIKDSELAELCKPLFP